MTFHMHSSTLISNLVSLTFPGSAQSPGMFGMPPPPLPNQSMTAIPAMGQTGAPVSGQSGQSSSVISFLIYTFYA